MPLTSHAPVAKMDVELDRRLTQNFSHSPSAQGRPLFIFNIISLIVIWFSVFLRVYVRSRVLKSWGPDDYLMIATLVGTWPNRTLRLRLIQC